MPKSVRCAVKPYGTAGVKTQTAISIGIRAKMTRRQIVQMDDPQIERRGQFNSAVPAVFC